MNIKYLLGFVVITSCFLASPGYASDKKQTEAGKKDQSPKSTLQVRRDASSGLPTGKRDVASGLPTGKRDAASGLPTGKRQHKPVSMTKHVDKSSPLMGRMGNHPLHAEKKSKSGYRLCPDGTRINPGEKCPVKNR